MNADWAAAPFWAADTQRDAAPRSPEMRRRHEIGAAIIRELETRAERLLRRPRESAEKHEIRKAEQRAKDAQILCALRCDADDQGRPAEILAWENLLHMAPDLVMAQERIRPGYGPRNGGDE